MNNRLFADPRLFGQMQQDPGYMYGQALLGSAASSAPVRSPLEGIARALQAVPAGFAIRSARKNAEGVLADKAEAYSAALQGGNILDALQVSDDPELQQMGLQARLKQQLDPQQDPLVKVFDQASGAEKWVKQSQAAGAQAAAPAVAKAPETRTIQRGGLDVYQQFDPKTGQFTDISSGPHFAPQQPPTPPEVIRLLQAANIDPKSPQGQAAIAHALGTEQKPQFGGVVTGPQAQALGLDPAGSYQQGPDGRWAPVTTPRPGGTFGPIITGPQAQSMGLDPKGSYQQGSDGKWTAVVSPQQGGGTFGKVITGADAKALGFDPNGVYQRGPDGKYAVVQAPQQQAGPIVSGAQAKGMGLDPAKTWQQNGNGQWSAIDKPGDGGTTWKTVSDANGKPLYQEGSNGERKAIPGQEGGGAFKQENTLRDEYNTLTKDFRTVQDAYNKIQSTSNTGAGDMSLLYSYVKLLDPGSVVRESEFATAAASGSFGQQIQGAVSRIMSGQRLPDSLRSSFKAEADRIYQGQKVGYDNAGKRYGDLATKAGIDPASVVVPYDTAPPMLPQANGGSPVPDLYQKYGLVPPSNAGAQQ